MSWYIALFIGYIIGIVCTLIISIVKKPDGIFKIDLGDPMDETLMIELLKPLAQIINKKYISFRVIIVYGESREKQRL